MNLPAPLAVLLLAVFPVAFAADPARTTRTAKGSFEVKVQPEGEPDAGEGNTLGRMVLDKVYAGDLVGTAKGTMLTAMTGTQSSAGYVAIERVSGSLHGRKGSFVFQHSGTMSRGAPQLSIRVVPDSGTGELAGIEGTFDLTIVDGKHLYEFEYSLPE